MIKKGDWVRFQKNGTLVIGIVQYPLDETKHSDYRIVITDVGEIYERDILEVRRKSVTNVLV